MFCTHCGAANLENNRFCGSCGQPLALTPPSTEPTPAVPMADGSAPRTSGKAIASLVLGFLSWMFPAAIAAIILGHIARSEIRKSTGRLKGSGLALTGLIFGYLGVVMIPILLITAAIAIPNLLRARTVANEAGAVGVVRTIANAQATYASTYPQNGYACRLSDLASAGLIDRELASGTKYGYKFLVSPCRTRPQPIFAVGAAPLAPGKTGVRAFCTDQTGVIRFDAGGDIKQCLDFGPPLAK
jgi:competence protein ComGC